MIIWGPTGPPADVTDFAFSALALLSTAAAVSDALTNRQWAALAAFAIVFAIMAGCAIIASALADWQTREQKEDGDG